MTGKSVWIFWLIFFSIPAWSGPIVPMSKSDQAVYSEIVSEYSSYLSNQRSGNPAGTYSSPKIVEWSNRLDGEIELIYRSLRTLVAENSDRFFEDVQNSISESQAIYADRSRVWQKNYAGMILRIEFVRQLLSYFEDTQEDLAKTDRQVHVNFLWQLWRNPGFEVANQKFPNSPLAGSWSSSIFFDRSIATPLWKKRGDIIFHFPVFQLVSEEFLANLNVRYPIFVVAVLRTGVFADGRNMGRSEVLFHDLTHAADVWSQFWFGKTDKSAERATERRIRAFNSSFQSLDSLTKSFLAFYLFHEHAGSQFGYWRTAQGIESVDIFEDLVPENFSNRYQELFRTTKLQEIRRLVRAFYRELNQKSACEGRFRIFL